jgi:hypothetical protein
LQLRLKLSKGQGHEQVDADQAPFHFGRYV